MACMPTLKCEVAGGWPAAPAGPLEGWGPSPSIFPLRPNQVLPNSLVPFRSYARCLNTFNYSQINSTNTGSCCFFHIYFCKHDGAVMGPWGGAGEPRVSDPGQN